MRSSHRLALGACLAAGLGALAAAGRGADAAGPAAPAPPEATAPETRTPATPPAPVAATTVQGTVTAESEVPLDEMVVYLESPDAGRPMPPPGAAVNVSQKGARFEPKLTVVAVGQTVNFPNDEEREIEHNVFSSSKAKKFDLGLYGPKQSKSVTFDKPGPVLLRCSIHRFMDGVVFVSPTPYWSLVDKDGGYKMSDVPPGKWTLKTWQGRRRFAEQTVPLALVEGKPVTVDLELKKRR
jgi:plastocyanin